MVDKVKALLRSEDVTVVAMTMIAITVGITIGMLLVYWVVTR